MFGHVGAVLAIDWAALGDLGADVGTSWWQVGARERQDDNQEGQVEPAWAPGGSQTGSTPWGGG